MVEAAEKSAAHFYLQQKIKFEGYLKLNRQKRRENPFGNNK